MSDGSGRDRNAASRPTDADVSRWRSQLEDLAQRRGGRAPSTGDPAQEILPPEGDRRAKLRELLRNRQGGDEPGGGGPRRGAGDAEEGNLRDQLVRRALQNRGGQRGEDDQPEGGEGRLLRRIREGGGAGRPGGPGGGDGRLAARLGDAGRGMGRDAGSTAPASRREEPFTNASKEPSMSNDENNRPLGVGDIPGSIRPDPSRRSEEGTAGGGPDRAKLAEFLRRRAGGGGGGGGGGGMGGGGGGGGGGGMGGGGGGRGPRQGMGGGGGGPRQGMGGGGGGGGGVRELAGRRGGEASGDAVVRGRELLDRLKSRLSESGDREGGQSQRLAAGIGLIEQGYTKLELEVERLKGELADAEEKIRVLLSND